MKETKIPPKVQIAYPEIGEFKGDVVEINYLDTTLWEFGGDYLTNDLPSGHLIRFPNTLVLQSEVYNYSWRNFHISGTRYLFILLMKVIQLR